MREVLVLMCLVLGTMADHHQCVDEDAEKADLETQNLRLNHLNSELETLQKESAARRSNNDDVEATLSALRKRWSKMQDSGCDDQSELQCGGEQPLCLSRLMVCDGSLDCPNGYDEEECRVFTPAGSIWEGQFEYDECTQRKPDKIRVAIDNYRVIHYLRPFPEVDATLEFKYDEDETYGAGSMQISGWMDLAPGEHILYFEAPETDGLALSCTFDGVDDNTCHGKILREKSQRTCAEFFMRRID